MHFLAQAAFGADAVAVADDEHADHQLGIDGGAARVTVMRRQMLAQLAQVKAGVDATQQMVLRYMFFQVEGVEQFLLPTFLLSHHGRYPEKMHIAYYIKGRAITQVFQQNRPSADVRCFRTAAIQTTALYFGSGRKANSHNSAEADLGYLSRLGRQCAGYLPFSRKSR